MLLISLFPELTDPPPPKKKQFSQRNILSVSKYKDLTFFHHWRTLKNNMNHHVHVYIRNSHLQLPLKEKKKKSNLCVIPKNGLY